MTLTQTLIAHSAAMGPQDARDYLDEAREQFSAKTKIKQVMGILQGPLFRYDRETDSYCWIHAS